MNREHEWDSRWWLPVINAEHLAMRERAAMLDLTAFAIFDVTGPGALDYMQKMAINQMNVKVDRAVYTPILDPNGGFCSDLTIMRIGRNHFRIVTGGADWGRDKHWLSIGSRDICLETALFTSMIGVRPFARSACGGPKRDIYIYAIYIYILWSPSRWTMSQMKGSRTAQQRKSRSVPFRRA